MRPPNLRIAIADDEPVIRNLLRHVLEASGDIVVVGEADDGFEALQICRDLQPDVVLMDISMPGMDGIEATRRLVEANGTDTKVLVLTGFEADDLITEALRVGASGFLHKERSLQHMVDAVRLVAGGETLLAPSGIRRLLAERTDRSRRLYESAVALTTRELEVLRLVGTGLSNSEIADQLSVAETTIRTHIGHILMKLGLRDRVQAVVYAYNHGIVEPKID